MNFILDAKVLFCGNWQNISDVFLKAKKKKVFRDIRFSFSLRFNFEQN